MMEEIYRDIKDYEGLYQVSNFGNVMSLNYRKTGRAELLKTYKNKKGYLLICLSKNKKQKTFQIHRLVAEAFIPNLENLPQVNHKDEDKTNNSVDNLEWCTNEYNHKYGTRNERIAKTLTNGKQSKPVLQFSKTGEFIKEWESSMEIQRQLGYCNSFIGKCCKGKYESAYGFRWIYK